MDNDEYLSTLVSSIAVRAITLVKDRMLSFSIITAVRNGASTLCGCIEGVKSQTYPAEKREHIIIDGGSTDGTQGIIEKHRSSLSHVISEPDNGIYDAMNKGLVLATGDVIGFLNADDFYRYEDVLSDIARAFDDTSIEACYADLCYVSQDKPEQISRYWKSSAIPAEAFVNSWVPPHPTFFVRRNVYERLGGFDLGYKIAADFELMLRFLKVNGIKSVYIPKVLVHMRLGGTSNRSFSNIIKQNKEIIRALKQHGYSTALSVFFIRKIILKCCQFISKEEPK